MIRFIVRRLLHRVPLLIAASFLSFALTTAMGDPLGDWKLQRPRTEGEIAAAYQRIGYDKPVLERYVDWAGRLRRRGLEDDGDPRQRHRRRPGGDRQGVLGDRPAGRRRRDHRGAARHGGRGDRRGPAVLAGSTTPRPGPRSCCSRCRCSAWPCCSSSAASSSTTGWRGTGSAAGSSPPGRRPAASPAPSPQQIYAYSGAYILPTLCLVAIQFALYSRFQRASMLDTLNADYVRTARAKGLSARRG